MTSNSPGERSLTPRAARVARGEKSREGVAEHDFFKELLIPRMLTYNLERRTMALLRYDLQSQPGAILGKT